MGVLTTFKTWPRHQNQFYKVSSNAICFWIKSSTSATVGLTDTPDEYCAYNLYLEQNNCSLKADCSPLCSITTPHILPRDKFKKFWITWNNGKINFGDEQKTIISYQCSVDHLKYITFYVTNGIRCVEWKCYLPPLIELLQTKEIQGGELKWVEMEEDREDLPEDALIGGYEQDFLYIMRTECSGSLLPGKYLPSLGVGFVAFRSYSLECMPREILCGYNCTWVPVNGNKLPLGAVEGGYTEDNEILHIGRVHHEAHLIIGKVQPSTKLCYFAYDNMRHEARFYDVLVQPLKETIDVVSIAAREFWNEEEDE